MDHQVDHPVQEDQDHPVQDTLVEGEAMEDHPVQVDQDTLVEGEAMEDLPVEAMVVVMVVKVGDPLEAVR